VKKSYAKIQLELADKHYATVHAILCCTMTLISAMQKGSSL